MRRNPWHDSILDFPDLKFRLSRLKFSARLCNLGLNPDAARPLARFMSRLSRPYVHTFQTQTLAATMQFEFKFGCGATLGMNQIQTFQTLSPDFPDSICRRDYAIWVQFRIRRSPWHDSILDFPDLKFRLSRLKFSARLCNLGLNPDAARPLARFMSRLSRPYVHTFQTQTLAATMQFEFKFGCGATLGMNQIQTFQTLSPDFPDSICRRDYAIWVQFRIRRSPWHDSNPDFPDFKLSISRLKLSARLCNLGLNPDARDPLHESCPEFQDLISILSRLKLSARQCNLNLNSDAA